MCAVCAAASGGHIPEVRLSALLGVLFLSVSCQELRGALRQALFNTPALFPCFKACVAVCAITSIGITAHKESGEISPMIWN